MSESQDPSGAPKAVIRRARRLPVIWVIPFAALIIGAWLAWDTLSKQGPTITVSFNSGEGLQAGQSQLKFKDIVLGTVANLELTPDHTRVLVRIDTTRAAERLLNDKTIFWVVKPRLFAGNISGLETLLSGNYVAMQPGQAGGRSQRDFTGRADPPILQADVPGRTFLLRAPRLGSVSLGSPVFFRDLSVGEVLGWDIADMAESVTIRAFVRAPFDQYVNADSRFWNASGLSLKLSGAGVELELESLRALILGGIAFSTPDSQVAASVSPADHVFPLFTDREAANAASYSRKIPAVSYFPGSVRGLAPGSEVTMHGLVVGHVTSVELHYDTSGSTIVAPVRYSVEPERVLGVGRRVFPTTHAAVEVFLQRGLRASLESASLITGQQLVTLGFDRDAPPVAITMDGNDFVVPTSDGGSFAGLQASAADLLDKVNTIPFKQIGDNLDGILRATNDLVNGQQVRQALIDLSATLRSTKELVGRIDTGAGPAMRQLPEITTTLNRTLGNVNKLTLSLDGGYGANTQFNRDLDRLLVQLNDAVRSIRTLADLLARHPEALVKGRPKGGIE